MKHSILYSLLSLFFLVTLTGSLSYAQPVWKFRVVVAVEKQTADYFQKAYAKDIKLIVKEQLTTVNANFNSSANFKGTFNFQADSVYVFDGNAPDEIFKPHPGYEYSIIINGFSAISSGGGWYGANHTIYHNWKWDYFDGPFAGTATDGLTHELGHARGAIDLYALQVDAQKNPVNGTSFDAINSIMNYPYGNIKWDEYTTNLLNATGAETIVGETYITGAFPGDIRLKAVDLQGAPLKNAILEVYPVEWFSNAVTANPVLKASTDDKGLYQFLSNPYQPAVSGYPWNIRYCNFLVKATYNSIVAYQWLPLYEVQNAYFRNGATTAYTTEIKFPVNTVSIKLSPLPATSFSPGGRIDASFTLSGIFGPDNVFTLQLIDSQENKYVVGNVMGNSAATITGIVSDLVPGNGYRVRLVSSKPYAQSDDVFITIKPATTVPLTLTQPAYSCQTGAIIFNVSGGDGSPITFTAPGIIRSAMTNSFGTVVPGLRSDPKVIPITATQNGVSATYLFDLKAACINTPLPRPPVLNRPIPDQFLTQGQGLPEGGFAVGLYFSDPSPYSPTYQSHWFFNVVGLPPGLSVFTLSLPGNNYNPVKTIVGTPQTTGVYTATITAGTEAFPNSPVITTVRFTVSPAAGPITLVQPTYNCQTGAIIFNVSGGDGSPITFTAPGIIRSSVTDRFGTVEAELRSDPKPLSIQATQRGLTVALIFDFGAYCRGLNPTLTLLAPGYDCTTGAIHFNTSGGDGTPIEFMAVGITPWTTNPDQVLDAVIRVASDVQPFTLLARQSGRVVSYSWDLKAACGRARVSANEVRPGLRVQVLGNPVDGPWATVDISGVAGESVQLTLFDLQGHLLHQERIEQAGATERVRVPVGANKGLFLLQASTTTEQQQVKLITP